jgi:hypothetical protein
MAAHKGRGEQGQAWLEQLLTDVTRGPLAAAAKWDAMMKVPPPWPKLGMRVVYSVFTEHPRFLVGRTWKKYSY